MSTGVRKPGPVAAVFDIGRPESREALIKVVGDGNIRQFETSGKPFVVLFVDAPDGDFSRLEFAGENELLEFYLSTLRINTKLDPGRRVQFVLRDLAPRFEDRMRLATQELAREFAATDAAQ
jgi:hypothetical protein